MNYFSSAEMACRCGCGEYFFDPTVLRALNAIREECGFPLPVSSGYRCLNHPVERVKPIGGAHTEGVAVDIAVTGEKALILLEVAIAMGCKRIGINQRGEYRQRFIHLDWSENLPSPALWSY